MMVLEGHEILDEWYADVEAYYDEDWYDDGSYEDDQASNGSSEQENYWKGSKGGGKSKGAGRHASSGCTTCGSKWHKPDDCPIHKLKGKSDDRHAGGGGHGSQHDDVLPQKPYYRKGGSKGKRKGGYKGSKGFGKGFRRKGKGKGNSSGWKSKGKGYYEEGSSSDDHADANYSVGFNSSNYHSIAEEDDDYDEDEDDEDDDEADCDQYHEDDPGQSFYYAPDHFHRPKAGRALVLDTSRTKQQTPRTSVTSSSSPAPAAQFSWML